MNTVYSAMLVTLGFLLAALLLLLLLPTYRRRIERFTSERIKRALPLTEDEIRADKDRMRASFALDVHRLETKIEEAAFLSARHSVELNRRDTIISDLENRINSERMTVEEHENARRVLEQAIMDRLPKVEQRLVDARRMLAERDADLKALTETGARQAEALEQATQMNVQLSDEAHRLRAALETRAARNREAIGDPRFDGEIALRTEIETLRSKTRDQSAMIDRLQRATANRDGAGDQSVAFDEVARLKAELARVESQLLSVQQRSDATDSAALQTLQARVRELETADHDAKADIAKLTAALKTFEEAAGDTPTARDTRLASKAQISALQTEVDEQRRTIQQLRTEIAGNNERLARQAQHFRDEMRRLGSNGMPPPLDGRRAAAPEPARRSLAERIAQPRIPRAEPAAEIAAAAAEGAIASDGRESRGHGFLKAVVNGDEAELASANMDADGQNDQADSAAPARAARRARLLERISSIEKLR
ncbi:MAG: hypothetical protein ACRCS9_15960 [Hyphomicrobium sp.]